MAPSRTDAPDLTQDVSEASARRRSQGHMHKARRD